jgi:hypothetical protein
MDGVQKLNISEGDICLASYSNYIYHLAVKNNMQHTFSEIKGMVGIYG